MKKVIVGLLALVGIVLGLVIAALIVHPLWLNSVVPPVVKCVAPDYTGTDVTLGGCDINLYGGRVALSDFVLANPEGCEEKTALSVGTLKVEVDPSTVLSDVIVIKTIEIRDVFLSYVHAPSGESNFSEIADHASAAAGLDETDGAAGTNDVAEATAPEGTESADSEADDGSGKKVIIEKFVLSGVKLSIYGLPLPVPGSIEITDIGKETQGVSWKGAWEEISAKVLKAIGGTGDALTGLLKGVDVKAAAEALKGVGVEDVTKGAADAATDLLKGSGEGVKAAGKQLEGLGKGLKGLFK